MPSAFQLPALPSLDDLVIDLEAALAPALAAGAGAAAGDAAAAARQVIGGVGLPAPWRERLGERPAVTLISFDADRIQSWVFSSGRVQVAGGASKRLDLVNRQAGERARRVEGMTGLVYSAGGGGMLFAEPGRDPDELAAAVRVHDLIRLAHRFGVSRIAAAYRLKNLRLVFQAELERLLAQEEEGRGRPDRALAPPAPWRRPLLVSRGHRADADCWSRAEGKRVRVLGDQQSRPARCLNSRNL